MAKRLSRLKIREVSSVDKGAGEGVRMVLFKREFSGKERDAAAASGAAMSDGSFPIKNAGDLKNAIQAIGRAKDQAAAKRHIISRARALGLTDQLPDGWINKRLEEIFAQKKLSVGKDGTISSDAGADLALIQKLDDDLKNRVSDAVDVFCESCREITAASDEADKQGLLEKSYAEFVEHVGELAPEGAEQAVAAAVLAELENEDEPMPMTDKEIEALKVAAAEAETLKAEVAKRDAEIAKRDAELAFAKMSDAHKAHAAKLSDAERAKFVALSAEERDSAVQAATKKRDEDPIFKAMNERIAKAESEAADLRKRLDAEHEEKEKASFAKRAVDTFNQPEAFGETLRKAYKGDTEAQAEVNKVVLSMKRVAETSATFKQFGGAGGGADSAKAEIAAKVDEIRKAAPTLSFEQAYSRAIQDPANRDLAKRVRDEERAGL
jgi:hypothetical protein